MKVGNRWDRGGRLENCRKEQAMRNSLDEGGFIFLRSEAWSRILRVFFNINVFSFLQTSVKVWWCLYSYTIVWWKAKESEDSLTHSHTKSFAICMLPLKTSRSNYWSEQWLGNSKSWVEEIKSIFNVEWLTYGNESISLFQIQDSSDHGEQ